MASELTGDLSMELDQEHGSRRYFTLWNSLALLLPLISAAPLLAGQAVALYENPATNLAPLFWLLIAIVIWWKAAGDESRDVGRVSMAIALLMMGVGVLGAAVMYWSFSLAQWSVVLFLIAWGLGRFHQTRWSQIAAWGIVLALTNSSVWPMPLLESWLSDSSASLASMTLDHYRVPHLLENGEVLLRDGRFAVMTIISPKLGFSLVVWATGLWCCFVSRSFLHSLILMCGVPFVVLLSRYFTILLIVYGFEHFREDWTKDMMHYSISIGALTACMLLILSLDQFLRAMLRPIPVTDPTALPIFAAANELIAWPTSEAQATDTAIDPDYDDGYDHAQNLILPETSKRATVNWRTHPFLKPAVMLAALMMIAFLGVSVSAVVSSGLFAIEADLPVMEFEELNKALNEEVLPRKIGNFERQSFTFSDQDASGLAVGPESGSGLSAQWTYQWNDIQVGVELTAPHLGWRAPLDGEQLKNSRTLVEFQESPLRKSGWSWFKCRHIGMFGEYSYHYECGLENDATPSALDSNKTTDSWPLLEKLNGGQVNQAPHVNYLISLFCNSGVPLSEQQEIELSTFFDSVRHTIRSRLKPGLLVAALESRAQVKDARQQ